MGKFRDSGASATPALSTTSTSDIVFILLFFFMVTSTMKETMVMVKETVPDLSEVKKLENKALVSTIHIGVPLPKYQKAFGTATRIQLSDQFATVDAIRDFVAAERDKMSEADRSKMTISLKIDEETKMGFVTDVKMALRRANALKISYGARKEVAKPSN